MKKKTIMGLEEKWEILLVYLFSILGFIFAFMKNENISDNMKFQYKQAGAIWIINMGLTIFGNILRFTIGFPLTLITSSLTLVLLVFSIITIVKGFEGETYEIPLISDMAKAIWK